jgi:hypothetical protein
MDSVDRETDAQPGLDRTPRQAWTAPKVILSDPLSSARHSNKGQNITPDNRALTLTSTSTS